MGYRRVRFVSVMECGDDRFRARNHLTGELTTLSEAAVQLWLAAGDSFIPLDLLMQSLPASLIEGFGADAIEEAVGALVQQGLIETEGSVRSLEQDDDVGRVRLPLGEPGLALIEQALRALAGRCILEVGCGDGGLLEQLAALEPDALLGVDLSAAAVARAGQRLRARGIEAHVQRGMAEALPVDDGAVNLLVVASSLAWFDERAFWREARRVVAPGDHAIVVLERAPAEGSLLATYLDQPPEVPGPEQEELPEGLGRRRVERHEEAIHLEDPDHFAALVRWWAPASRREGWPDPLAFAQDAGVRWPLRLPCSVSLALIEGEEVAPVAVERTADPNATRCAGCGSDGAGLDEGAAPGCPRCYQTFADMLLPRIQELHGVTEHVAAEHVAAEHERAADARQPRAGREVALSSRVRLARTLDGLPFPHAMSPEQTEALLGRVEAAIGDQGASLRRVSSLDEREVALLLERRQISKELVAADRGGAVAIIDDHTSLMVPEEDHLRLQSIRPGLDLVGALGDVRAVASRLAAGLRLARDPRLGHLTACPTNLGTGLRASCLLHLPALLVTGALEPALGELAAEGLAVRGAAGEGSHGRASLWQISNRATLGRREEQLVVEVQQVVEDLVARELRAREDLASEPPAKVADRLWRAMGTLRNARLISRSEATACLSLAQLGQAIGLLTGAADLDEEALHGLLLQIQPAHLGLALERDIPPEELDRARAELLRSRF
jgi:protein arginine kinase